MAAQVKWAFINEGKLKDAIKTGKVDEYDVVVTNDTNILYFIDDKLNPIK